MAPIPPPRDRRTPLKIAMFRMKLADPRVFDEFLTEFRKYTEDKLIAVAEATANDILEKKGNAQQCRALLRDFEECHIEPQNPQPAPLVPR